MVKSLANRCSRFIDGLSSVSRLMARGGKGELRMGTFRVGCKIQHIADSKKTAKVEKLLVDTGSDYTWLPANVLERLSCVWERFGSVAKSSTLPIRKRRRRSRNCWWTRVAITRGCRRMYWKGSVAYGNVSGRLQNPAHCRFEKDGEGREIVGGHG